MCGGLRGREVLPLGPGCCRKASWKGRLSVGQTGADRQKGQPVVAGHLLGEAGSSMSVLSRLQGAGVGVPLPSPKTSFPPGGGLPRGSSALRLPGHGALCRAHAQRAAARGHGQAHACPFRSLASVRPGTAGLPAYRVCLFLLGLGWFFFIRVGAWGGVETVPGARVRAKLAGPRELVGQQSCHSVGGHVLQPLG